MAVSGSAGALGTVVEAGEDGWEALASGGLPLVVDLWAPWCGPCRALAPLLERVAAEFGGRVMAVKVNVDEESRLAEAFGVRSLPTLHVVRDGQVVVTRVGLPTEAQLRELFEAAARPV